MPAKNGTPDRWEKYTKYGTVVDGTRFLPFKVPLKESFYRNLPKGEWFTPASLRHQFKNIGLVIDLTNTTKYYDPLQFSGYKISYEKIFCEGHGKVPPPQVTNRLFAIVDAFLSDRSQDGRIIGVHCTHGLNRTGYFICKYMIERLNVDPEKAIAEFEKARGHPIERQEYIRDLFHPETSTNSQSPSSRDSALRDVKPQMAHPLSLANRKSRYGEPPKRSLHPLSSVGERQSSSAERVVERFSSSASRDGERQHSFAGRERQQTSTARVDERHPFSRNVLLQGLEYSRNVNYDQSQQFNTAHPRRRVADYIGQRHNVPTDHSNPAMGERLLAERTVPIVEHNESIHSQYQPTYSQSLTPNHQRFGQPDFPERNMYSEGRQEPVVQPVYYQQQTNASTYFNEITAARQQAAQPQMMRQPSSYRSPFQEQIHYQQEPPRLRTAPQVDGRFNPYSLESSNHLQYYQDNGRDYNDGSRQTRGEDYNTEHQMMAGLSRGRARGLINHFHKAQMESGRGRGHVGENFLNPPLGLGRAQIRRPREF